MTFNPDSYNTASTVMHAAQGAALLVLGLTEAYAVREPGGRMKLASPLVFLLCGTAMLLAMLYFLGGWSLKNALFSLRIKSGFYIFISFACFYASAGLSQLTFFATEEKGRGWHYLFLAFLAVIGLLYFGMSQKVNSGAAVEVAAYHSAFGFTLLAAVIFKFLHGFRPRKAFNLAWIVLLLVSSFQLLSYREVAGAFDLAALKPQAPILMVLPPAKVARSGADSPGRSGGAKQDVKPAHTERAGN